MKKLTTALLLGCLLAWNMLLAAEMPPPPLLASASPAPLPDTSVYNLPSRWSDQNGKELKLEELRGQVRVVAMIYTECQAICPAIVQAMKNTESQLTPEERGRVGFVLVSIDPAVDSSEKLKAYSAKQNLGKAWRLLRGDPEDVRELAATFNFKYRKTSQKDYAHSAMITVLDENGDVVHQHLGLTGGAEDRMAAIHKLLKTGP